MLGVKRRTAMDGMKETVREAVAYMDEVAGDGACGGLALRDEPWR